MRCALQSLKESIQVVHECNVEAKKATGTASYLIPAVRLCILDDSVLRWEYSLGFGWGVGDSQEASWV